MLGVSGQSAPSLKRVGFYSFSFAARLFSFRLFELWIGGGPCSRALSAAVLRKIWHEDGPKGFYRGLGPTIFGYLPTWAIYFTVYDACKSGFARRGECCWRRAAPRRSADARRTENAHDDEFLVHIASAMTAGAASTCCTSPLWVVKTRFMVRQALARSAHTRLLTLLHPQLQSTKDSDVRPYRHTGDAFVQIWRTEGFRGFYRGLLPSLFGVSHVAIQFPLYEQFKSWTSE